MNNAPDFVETTNNGDKFIMVDVHEDTSAAECGYKKRNKLIIVLYFVFNGYPETSLVQDKLIISISIQ